MKFFHRLFGRRKQRQPRTDVQFVSYALADEMLRRNEGWQIAPEEDSNRLIGFVWLERVAQPNQKETK